MNNSFKKNCTNEDFFQVIGKISVVFATMDFFVTQLLFRLMSAKDYDGLKINDNTPLGKKLKKLSEIKESDVDYPQAMIELRKILPRAISVAEERNRYIHDQWVFDEKKVSNGEIDRIRLKRRNDFSINVTNMNEKVTKKIEDLNIFCNEVIEVGDLIWKNVESIPSINIDNVRRK